jgi:hypothetical protein
VFDSCANYPFLGAESRSTSPMTSRQLIQSVFHQVLSDFSLSFYQSGKSAFLFPTVILLSAYALTRPRIAVVGKRFIRSLKKNGATRLPSRLCNVVCCHGKFFASSRAWLLSRDVTDSPDNYTLRPRRVDHLTQQRVHFCRA